jgi:hypothetical protein
MLVTVQMHGAREQRGVVMEIRHEQSPSSSRLTYRT